VTARRQCPDPDRSTSARGAHRGHGILVVQWEVTKGPRQMKRLPRERREQYGRDRDRIKFGTQGAASEVRKIDVASVDTAALMEQLLRQPPPASPAKQGFIASKKRFFLQKGKAINNDDIQVWYRQLFQRREQLRSVCSALPKTTSRIWLNRSSERHLSFERTARMPLK
jgi:hypothetical protein